MEFLNHPSDGEIVSSNARQAHAEQDPQRHRGIIASVFVMVLILLTATILAIRPHSGLITPGTTLHGTSTIPIIHTGKVLCTAAYSTSALPFEFIQPPLVWSANGVIASGNPLKTFDAQTCAIKALINLPETTLAQPVWSPDGQRLLLLHGVIAEVRDTTTGNILTSFQADGSDSFTQGAWVANGAQLILLEGNVLGHTTMSVRIQIRDGHSGALIRTPLTFDDGILIGSAWLSPIGQILATQGSDHRITFWDIETGQIVSTTPTSVDGNAQPFAWSPDGVSLAIGIGSANWPAQPSEVQIWSSATGQLTATFQDINTYEGDIGGLAWSPNGKYLAEGSAEIHIWNVATGQLAATFGKITATDISTDDGATHTLTRIVSIAWAPDSGRLASVTASTTFPLYLESSEPIILNVWQLS